MPKKYTKKHVAIFCVVLAVIVVFAYFGLMLRDYNLVFDGGPHFVSKEPVPAVPSFQINNSTPGKLVVTVPANAKTTGFEVAYSVFPNMLFAKSYNVAFGGSNRIDLSLLFSGWKYYVRVRYYKKNSANRKVNGQWTSVKSSTVR